MTYCLGIITKHGLIMASDSRTNAGVDYISTYQKLFDLSNPGERVIIICTSGNLSLTQSTITLLRQDLKLGASSNLHTLPNFHEIARYIGNKVRLIQEQDKSWLDKDNIDFSGSFLLGGQIKGEPTELYLIYSQGNFIQATKETTFLQIGETKYGKPILDRTLKYETPLEVAAKCALLSIDSTMKSNISVGPPISLVRYENNSYVMRHHLKLAFRDPYLLKMRSLWEDYIKKAFDLMPNLEWECSSESDDLIGNE